MRLIFGNANGLQLDCQYFATYTTHQLMDFKLVCHGEEFEEMNEFNTYCKEDAEVLHIIVRTLKNSRRVVMEHHRSGLRQKTVAKVR